jgi:hypothetical protein
VGFRIVQASGQARFGVFTTREIDAACEFVLARIEAGAAEPGASGSDAVRALVEQMADHQPDASALSPVLPLALAAAALDEMLDGPAAQTAARALWRGAALLAAEVLALQAQTPDAPPRLAALAARLRASP